MKWNQFDREPAIWFQQFDKYQKKQICYAKEEVSGIFVIQEYMPLFSANQISECVNSLWN